MRKMMQKRIWALYALLWVVVAARSAWAEAAGGEPPVIDPNVLAAAAVPFITFAVKYIVAHWVPDTLIVSLRDRWVPFLIPIFAVLGKSLAEGSLDLSQGALIGLAGIGLHQVVKATGIIQKTGAVIPTDKQADATAARL